MNGSDSKNGTEGTFDYKGIIVWKRAEVTSIAAYRYGLKLIGIGPRSSFQKDKILNLSDLFVFKPCNNLVIIVFGV